MSKTSKRQAKPVAAEMNLTPTPREAKEAEKHGFMLVVGPGAEPHWLIVREGLILARYWLRNRCLQVSVPAIGGGPCLSFEHALHTLGTLRADNAELLGRMIEEIDKLPEPTRSKLRGHAGRLKDAILHPNPRQGDEPGSDDWYRRQARRRYRQDGECEIDKDATVSLREDDGAKIPGGYVMAWVWVDGPETEDA